MDIIVSFIRLTHEHNWVGYLFLGTILSISVWAFWNWQYGHGSARARALVMCLVMTLLAVVNLVLFFGWLKFKGYIP